MSKTINQRSTRNKEPVALRVWQSNLRLQSKALIFFMTLAVLIAGLPSSAKACSFHNYKPTKTLIDFLLNSDTLVLARPDKASPFKYQILEEIRGTSSGSDIPFLIDSVSRSRLADNPDDSMLFARNGSESWINIGYMDAENRQLVNTVLEKASLWRSEKFHPDRFVVMADYLDHPNAKLRTLAIQELDRVPYAMLRTLDVRIPERNLFRSLGLLSEYSYRPINYLLLGLSGSDRARQHITRSIVEMLELEAVTSLDAVATALIELEGVEAVHMLDQLYLSDPGQSLGKLESVVEAMAIHNTLGSEDLRYAIEKSLLGLVTHRPDSAAVIARQFSSRQDWSFGKHLEDLLKSKPDMTPPSRLMAVVYIAQSKANQN